MLRVDHWDVQTYGSLLVDVAGRVTKVGRTFGASITPSGTLTLGINGLVGACSSSWDTL